MFPAVSTTPEVDALIAAGAPVGIGVSGGKDSSAVAFATVAHLDRVGHRGPRLLIHSDLGATEWKESREWCDKLASRLGLELVVVRREKGDMMDRWEQRWADNVARYESLRCVQLILPWSTPDMRFCTSEMKVSPICRELSQKFPGQQILSVNGIRRQESPGRAKKPVSKLQPKLRSVRRATSGVDWHPTIEWSLDEVLAYLKHVDFPLHPAYLLWMLTRVSCVFCIMSSRGDMENAARCPSNHAIYRRMVRLEIRSMFAFHGSIWLGDIASDLLTSDDRDGLACAKTKAGLRRQIEATIPRDLLYVQGWPIAIPTKPAAELLCRVRKQVGDLIGLDVDYVEPKRLIGRYEELWNLKHAN